VNAMDEKTLRRILRVQGRMGDEPGTRCPGETDISAYLEHRLSSKDEARVESHLADCDGCLEQVTLLMRQPAAAASPVAPQVVSRARNLVADSPVAWRAPVLRWGAIAATAAGIMLVVSLQLRAPGVMPVPPVPATDSPASAPNLPAPPATDSPASAPNLPAPSATLPAPPAATPLAPIPQQPAAISPPAVRNSHPKPLQLELEFPVENATLSPKQLEFRWLGVAAATYYEVHIVTEDGNVVWLGKVEGTVVRLSDGVPLETGRKYFVWVRAYLSGGGTVKSAAVSFRVGGS
jgi:hypothetical protein